MLESKKIKNEMPDKTLDSKKSKVERLRFTPEEDLILLREVVAHNPFGNSANWTALHQNVISTADRPFTLRAVKDRLDYILNKNFRWCGSDVQFIEKEQLMLDIRDLEYKHGKTKKNEIIRIKEKDHSNPSVEEVEEVCNSDMLSYEEPVEYTISVVEEVEDPTTILNESNTIKVQNNNRKYHQVQNNNNNTSKRTSYLQKQSLLESKFKQQQLRIEERRVALEEKKLAIEERKIALEEAKFECDKAERLERLQMEAKERQMYHGLIQNQKEMMNFFMKQLENNKS